jgi:hypothetical protein
MVLQSVVAKTDRIVQSILSLLNDQVYELDPGGCLVYSQIVIGFVMLIV